MKGKYVMVSFFLCSWKMDWIQESSLSLKLKLCKYFNLKVKVKWFFKTNIQLSEQSDRDET